MGKSQFPACIFPTLVRQKENRKVLLVLHHNPKVIVQAFLVSQQQQLELQKSTLHIMRGREGGTARMKQYQIGGFHSHGYSYLSLPCGLVNMYQNSGGRCSYSHTMGKVRHLS